MAENQHIMYALTLTTGDDINSLFIKKQWKNIIELLHKYNKYFDDYLICIELLDKDFIETKIHFHGYVKVLVSNVCYFNDFIREYNKKYFSKIKLINDFEKWVEYCLKQQFVIESSYMKRYDMEYNIITKKDLPPLNSSNLLLKYKRAKQDGLHGV